MKTNCYICHNRIVKGGRYIDVIVNSSNKGNDGFVTQLRIHDKCLHKFLTKFINIGDCDETK